MRTLRRIVPVPAALAIAALALTGCSSIPSPASPPSSAPSSSSPAASATTPSTPAPTPADSPQAPRRVVEAGISLEVPAGWSATTMAPADRQAAVDAQQDPRVADFLETRLEMMATTGGVVYLYDLGEIDRGALSSVEVYRYAGTDPQAVADEVVLPKMTEAGLDPVTGTVDVPAGRAITISARLERPPVSVVNEVAVLSLGPSVISLSSTSSSPDAPQVPDVLASVRAA